MKINCKINVIVMNLSYSELKVLKYTKKILISFCKKSLFTLIINIYSAALHLFARIRS